jgi:hypothetical protein
MLRSSPDQFKRQLALQAITVVKGDELLTEALHWRSHIDISVTNQNPARIFLPLGYQGGKRFS